MEILPTELAAVDELIARTCGWTEHEIGDGGIFGWLPPNGKHKKSWWSSYYDIKELPKYSTNLDAMHEAEEYIKKDPTTWELYCKMLARICMPASPVNATAIQKTRAFMIASTAQATLEMEECEIIEF